jgi:dTDP-4-dehydrorhamnose reductase
MAKKIVVTGGSGLLALNWAITVRDRFSVTLGFHKRKISLPNVESQAVDLESPSNLAGLLKKIQPQLVVHTAGLTNVEECEANPDLARHVNVDLSVNVAKACASLDVSLIHISTDHLFSGTKGMLEETCERHPKNIYASTKAEAEDRIQEFYPEALVLRTNFYGWGPRFRRSFSDFIIDSLRERKSIMLFEDVQYTPILAETLVRIAHALAEKKAAGIFNVVGDDRISKHEFGRKIADAFKLDPSYIRPGSLGGNTAFVTRPLDMSLSNRKTSELLGRKIGGVDAHIAQLRVQEENGIAAEIQNA